MVDVKTKKRKQNKTTIFESYLTHFMRDEFLNWQSAKIVHENVRLSPFNIDSESSVDNF